MKIYTKTGDKGSTGLFDGLRVSKSSLRVETYGTIDELNSIIGIVLAHDPCQRIKQDLTKLSNILFRAGSDLATPLESKLKFEIKRIGNEDIKWLETLIDEYTAELPELRHFILPGGTKPAAFLHQARTVCRRAERLAVQLSEYENLGEYILIFLNRLSDYLFTAARFENYKAGISDIIKEK